MALSDKLKDLRSKAEEAVVERKDQINQAVNKAGEVADQRTGGRYHEQIQKAGEKAVGLVEGLEGNDAGATPDPAVPPASETQTGTAAANPPGGPTAGGS
ncbi:MAG TPA: antitoxin [Solirubrobacteraceae bacterium]